MLLGDGVSGVRESFYLKSKIKDLRVEAGFEGSLAAKDTHFEDCFDGLHCAEWWALVQSWLTEIQMVFELLAQPKAARHAKARA